MNYKSKASNRRGSPRSLFVVVRAIVAIFLLLSCLPVSAEREGLTSFDHLAETGFELTPVHRLTACESCHLFGVFKGTPRTCRGCHGSQGIRTASRKGARHILSSDNCELCHMTSTASSWEPVRRVDHLEVLGSCFSCHNGMIAQGKSANHVPSGNRCDDCHNTRSWLPARFSHEGIFSNCVQCHNGAVATGKHPQHINSTNICEACHTSTRVWVPVGRVDHNEIPLAGAGQCAICHLGDIPPAPHPPPGTECSVCHTVTTDWCSGTPFDIPGLCGD